jgi:archaellum component FlaF (FlaF/FlaG flagellin family)
MSESEGYSCYFLCVTVSIFLCSQRRNVTNLKNLGSTGTQTACSMAVEGVVICQNEQGACIQWFGVVSATVRCAAVQYRVCTVRNEGCVHYATVIRDSGLY